MERRILQPNRQHKNNPNQLPKKTIQLHQKKLQQHTPQLQRLKHQTRNTTKHTPNRQRNKLQPNPTNKQTTNNKLNRQQTKCLQKQLKLKPQDKIKIIQTTNEGYTVGKHESASGKAITSKNIYTSYWLEHNKKKGYYLNYTKPIKIIDLDKTE